MNTINSLEVLVLKEIAKSEAEISKIYVHPKTIYIGEVPYDESVLESIEKFTLMGLLKVQEYETKKVYLVTESFQAELTKYLTPQEKMKLQENRNGNI